MVCGSVCDSVARLIDSSFVIGLAGMLCVIFSTALWLLLATKLHMPVSTTQATVGGIIGIALVARGSDAVQWSGVGLIVASWFVSPLLAAALSGGIFWLVRRYILRSERPFDNALLSLPFLVGCTLAVNVFFIVYEGPESLRDTPLWAAVVASLGAGILTAVVVYFCVIPRVRKNIKADERAGLVAGGDDTPSQEDGGAAVSPNLASPPAVVIEMVRPAEAESDATEANEAPPDSDGTPEVSEGASEPPLEGEEGGAAGVREGATASTEAAAEETEQDSKQLLSDLDSPEAASPSAAAETGEDAASSRGVGGGGGQKRLGAGLNHDIHAEATGGDATVAAIHAQGEVFEPRTERVFTYLQVVTACFDSFGHGANDVANSIGPLAAIVAIYETSTVDSRASVPLWILALGGVGIVVGLATLGYEIIKAIGVRLSKITPSRGFTIEIGAAFVIVVGSRLGLPLSTTQAQIGSTVGVALLEGRRDAVNWKALVRVFLGWVLTLVVTGTVAATLFAFCVYAPSVPSGPLHSAAVAAANVTGSSFD